MTTFRLRRKMAVISFETVLQLIVEKMCLTNEVKTIWNKLLTIRKLTERFNNLEYEKNIACYTNRTDFLRQERQ